MTPVIRGSIDLATDQTAGPGVTRQNANKQHKHGIIQTVPPELVFRELKTYLVKLMSTW